MISTPAHLYDEERDLELKSIDRGVARYRELMSEQSLARHPPAMRLIRDAMSMLIPAIEEAQMNVLERKMIKGIRKWGPPLVSLPAERLALITLITMVNNSTTEEGTNTRCALAIGKHVDIERCFDKIKRKEKKAYADMVRYTPEWTQEKALKLAKKVGYSVPNDTSVRVHTGGFLMYLALTHCHIFVKQRSSKSSNAQTIRLKPDAAEFIRSRHDDFEILQPYYLPMVVPPKPWTDLYEGGYEWHRIPLVKEDFRRRSGITKLSQVGGMLSAVNSLQRTAWRINRRVFDVLDQVVSTDSSLGGLPDMMDKPLPPADELILNDPTRKSRWLFDRKQIHEYNRKESSKRLALFHQLHIAKDFRKYDALWFVWQLDWRGRIYPVGTALNPQSDDVGKALLEFAEPKPLGKDGLYWLTIHLANCIGWDKDELEEKVRKVYAIKEEIRGWAADPLTHRGWADCDSPYRVLAAAHEWGDAVVLPDQGAAYESRIPVAMDGTCNGLQHLSALGRDPVGACATNLIDSPRPSDIYRNVLAEVERTIEHDLAVGDGLRKEAATAWRPHVTRKTCKRGTMTTPYGVTPQGMRTQLLKDGLVDEVPGEVNNNLNYMRDCLHEAIGKVVVEGRKIMDWLQECARTMAHQELPCSWTTPLGFYVNQEYLVMRQRFVFTLLQKFGTWVPKKDRNLLKSRQIRGIAPNYIHSLDACHMGMSINRMVESGIANVHAVHDSFGTHACDITEMHKIVREEFVKMHTPDLLEDFRAQQGVDLPVPPEKGDFELKEVLGSTHFVG